MWKRFNPNPQGLIVGDCTVRAICAVTGRDWYSVHEELCDLARDMADMPSANWVFAAYMKDIGFSRQTLIDQCPDCYTVADFAADHPKGLYVLGPPNHAVAVIDGCYMDSADRRAQGLLLHHSPAECGGGSRHSAGNDQPAKRKPGH